MRNLFLLFSISLFFYFNSFDFVQARNKNTEAYGYQHLVGVTGINTILHKGKDKFLVKFSKDSNERALTALRNLGWQVLYPNADGKNIILYGNLKPEILKSPSGKGLPNTEKYQEFTLIHWYIKHPIKYYHQDNPLEVPFKTLTKGSLYEAGYKYYEFQSEEYLYEEYEKPLDKNLE